MADKRTTEETLRTPIDGTELVRLATPGFNFQASLSAILTTLVDEVLTGNRTYYVRTGGQDSTTHTGLTDVDGDAWATTQYAYNYIVAHVDTAGFTVTIQMQNAAWTVGLDILTGWHGSGKIIFDWGGGSLTTSNDDCVYCPAFLNGIIQFQNVTFSSSGSGHALDFTGGAGVVWTGAGMVFGAVTAGYAHILMAGAFQFIALNNYTVSGGTGVHWLASNGATINASGRTLTISGTPAFGTAFAYAINQGIVICDGNTYSGSATGPRYYALQGGVIQSSGGASALPGNSDGTADTGGVIVF